MQTIGRSAQRCTTAAQPRQSLASIQGPLGPIAPLHPSFIRCVFSGGGRGGGQGGRGFWTQNLVYQKWPDQIFRIVNFVFSRDGHFGLGRGGGGFGGGVPPPLWFLIILKKPGGHCPSHAHALCFKGMVAQAMAQGPVPGVGCGCMTDAQEACLIPATTPKVSGACQGGGGG